MAFFNRFFSTLNKKRESITTTASTAAEEPSIWRQHFTTMPENCEYIMIMEEKLRKGDYLVFGFSGNVRVVLFRECERRGKTLLFDSSTVERHRLSGNPEQDSKEAYIEAEDGWGYRYQQPPARDVRLLSEMIFGGAAVTHPGPNMKLHHVDTASLMWSSVLQAPHPAR